MFLVMEKHYHFQQQNKQLFNTFAAVNASQTITRPSCELLTRWRLSLDQLQDNTFPIWPLRCRRGFILITDI